MAEQKALTVNNSPVQARWNWLRRLEERGVRPTLALCLLVCALCLLYLYQNSTVATTAYAIRELEATRAHLLRRHEQLQARAAELESLDRIRKRAAELGLVESTQVYFLRVADLPAEKPVVHAFAPGTPASPMAGSASGGTPSLWTDIWQAFTGQLAAWEGQPTGPQARSP